MIDFFANFAKMLRSVNPALFVKKVLDIDDTCYVLMTDGVLFEHNLRKNDFGVRCCEGMIINDIISGTNDANECVILGILHNGYQICKNITDENSWILRKNFKLCVDTYWYRSRYVIESGNLYFARMFITAVNNTKYSKIGIDYDVEQAIVLWYNDGTVKVFFDNVEEFGNSPIKEAFGRMDRYKIFVAFWAFCATISRSRHIYIFYDTSGYLNIIVGNNLYKSKHVVKEYVMIGDAIRMVCAHEILYFDYLHERWGTQLGDSVTKLGEIVGLKSIIYSYVAQNDNIYLHHSRNNTNECELFRFRTWRDNIDRAGQLYDVSFIF